MKTIKKVVLFMLILCLTSCSIINNNQKVVDIVQKKKNYLEVNVKAINELPNGAEKILITGNMLYKKEVAATFEKELPVSNDVSFEVPYFGKWEITTKILNDKDKVIAKQKDTVGVTASEYNIAPLIATVPVLIFSLKYFYEIPTKTENNDPIPTIVTLARDDQYDYNNLPENMYINPLLNEKDKTPYDFAVLNVQMPKIAYYVKELYELDNTSRFTFYVNDYHIGKVLPQMIYENNLPENSYSLRLITDGTSSYKVFKNLYDTDNAFAVHEKMIEEYKAFKDSIINKGYKLSIDEQEYFQNFEYAILDVEKDVEWWVIRKSGGDTFKIKDEKFLQKLLDDTRVSNNYINGLLSKVEEVGASKQLKDLYKFEDDVYVKAEEQNKKPLMILGTSAKTEAETPIDEYIKITQAIYGDDYLYIYKGHPGNIPSEERIKELEQMNTELVDASIAAELFLFYHPETLLAGYPSTTFLSAQADKCLATYVLTKNRAYYTKNEPYEGVKDYADMIDVFISDLNAENNLPPSERIDQNIYNILPNKDHHYYLLEFNNNEEHSIGLWDIDLQELSYYKLENNEYIKVQ